MATDFGPRDRQERNPATQVDFLLRWQKQIFTPATDEEIDQYRKDYEHWSERSEKALRDFHLAKQKDEHQPVFKFQVANSGTRPAADALVTIVAKGRIAIMPPRRTDDDDDGDNDEGADFLSAELPKPPSPPRGRWKSAYEAFLGTFDALGSFGNRRLESGVIADYLRGPILPRPRDHNSFYYKPDKPDRPVSEFSLECKQWRHGVEPEIFAGVILFAKDVQEVDSAIECRVHAVNVSNIASMLVPVRITVEHVDAYPIAKEAVERLSVLRAA